MVPPFPPICIKKHPSAPNLTRVATFPRLITLWHSLCQHEAKSKTQLQTHQSFSILNFKFWAQSYLEFADIRNLQQPLAYFCSRDHLPQVLAQTLSSQPITTLQLYIFWGLFTSYQIFPFWHCHVFGGAHLSKKLQRRTSDHSLIESCNVTTDHHHHYQWGHAGNI